MPSPAEIVRTARPGRDVVGWSLDRDQRLDLLGRFPPKYGKVVADHVTLAAKVAHETPLPDDVIAQLVGRVDDCRGVEALVVSLEGATDRPDGSIYHITWSLASGRAARESNNVLAAQPWEVLPEPVELKLMPARWP